MRENKCYVTDKITMFFQKLYVYQIMSFPGGVRTLITLHNGQITKVELFAYWPVEVNTLGGSEIPLEYTWIVMWIRCLLPFLRKLKLLMGLRDSCHSSVTNSFLGGNFSERFQTAICLRISTQMATVTLTTDGGINNFKVSTYVPGRELFKCDPGLDMQMHIRRTFPPKVTTGFAKGEAPRLLRTNLSRYAFSKNV